jgi:hypothetical protein
MEAAKTMLQITNDAAHICNESVRQLSLLANSKLLRINKDGNGVSITLEAPQDRDEIVRYCGRPVVAVPDEIAGELSDMTLDVSKEGVFVLA